jgi:hypothetical protein
MNNMDKLEAIKYLIEHEFNGDEWQEAGMYHAIKEVIEFKGFISNNHLDRLLKQVENN